MEPELKELGIIELGALRARIVVDHEGRECIAVPIGMREVCFTVTQALLVRELLDRALEGMARLTYRTPSKEQP